MGQENDSGLLDSGRTSSFRWCEAPGERGLAKVRKTLGAVARSSELRGGVWGVGRRASGEVQEPVCSIWQGGGALSRATQAAARLEPTRERLDFLLKHDVSVT